MPAPTMETLAALLRNLGVTVEDMRGQLPVHASKRFKLRDPAQLLGLTAHHSAGPTGMFDRFKAVARYHVAPNHVSSTGAPGILYSLGVATDGCVCLFHDLDVATWSQGTSKRHGDENAQFLAVLCLGDFSSPGHPAGEPTPEQLHGFLAVVVACRQLWGSGFDLTGHYMLGKPACPGSTLQALVEAMRTHVTQPAPAAYLCSFRGVQKALASLGYSPGPADGVDGKVGPATRAALRAALQ